MRRDRYAVITREMCREFGIVQRLDVLVPEPLSVYRLLKSGEPAVRAWFNLESDRAMAFLGPLLPRGMVPFVYCTLFREIDRPQTPLRLCRLAEHFGSQAYDVLARYHTFRPGAATAVLRRAYCGVPGLGAAAAFYDRYTSAYGIPAIRRGVRTTSGRLRRTTIDKFRCTTSARFRFSAYAWTLRELTKPPCGKRLDALLWACIKLDSNRHWHSTAKFRSDVWCRGTWTAPSVLTRAFRDWENAGKPGLRGTAVRAA